MDDVIVYGKNINEFMENLEIFHQRMREMNLKLQPDKCEFLREELSYLGHLITSEGVKPNPDKIKAIREFPTPTNKKHLKSFLGQTNYYRKFIKDFSLKARKLNELLSKDKDFK